ncbi:MAG: penicillin-binding protein 1A [Acidobacteriota bacterium]
MPIKRDHPFPTLFPSLAVPRWVVFASFGVAVIAGVLGAVAGSFLNADLPDVRALEDYQPPTISQILAYDGRVVQQFAEQRRILVPLHRISRSLQNAVIAVEDANFQNHVGVDPMAILRAVLRDLREGRWAEGGSTLTQQLAKILFLKPEKTIRRKLQEALLAMHIEKTYTKEEILAFYLNQIYMGHGRYGVEAAARFYFGRSASDLGLSQAALLAGLIQRPESYSPIRHPQRATRRRNKVLKRMLAEGYISPDAAKSAAAEPVQVIRHAAHGETAPYFAEEIRKTLVQRYGADALLREGLIIKTGLDLDLQEAANRALSRGLRDLDKRRGFRRPATNILRDGLGTLETYQHPGWEKNLTRGDLVTGLVMDVVPDSATIRVGLRFAEISPSDAEWTETRDLTELLSPGDLTLFEIKDLDETSMKLALDQEPLVQGAVVAMDPRTGDIKAMVGGFDFDTSQFDRAVQAKRQSGSAFKPFIYAAAIAAGYRPSDLLFDQPTVFVNSSTGETYQPENYSRRYHGVLTMRRALEESINIPTVELLNRIGYRRTVNFARRLGFSSQLYPYPSLALGSSEVTLLELTTAYGVFPAGGILSKPRYFKEIRDRDGNVLEQVKRERKEVLRADVAAVMVSMMRGVIQRGTGRAASRLEAPLAGKTGTTDDYTDAWFIGYSPSLTLGVWVGHDQKVTLGPKETGARAALPIWVEVMNAYLETHGPEEFPTGQGVVTLPVDADTGLRVAPEAGCHNIIMETFIKGTEIERPCTAAAHLRLSLPYYLQRYPISGSRLAIGKVELARLLRENPFDLDLFGRSLDVTMTATGSRMVQLTSRDPLGGELTWGVFHFPTPSPSPDEDELENHQLLPSDLPPIDTSDTPYLGLDARTAAIIEIQRR